MNGIISDGPMHDDVIDGGDDGNPVLTCLESRLCIECQYGTQE